MNKPFDLQKALDGAKVVTRDGRPVKIAGYNPDSKNGSYILGWLDGFGCSWLADGSYDERFDCQTCKDLFMAPTERKEWIVRLEKNSRDVSFHGPFDEAGIKGIADNFPDEIVTIHEITIIE